MPILATYNPDEPTEMEKKLLMSLVFTSDLHSDEKEEMMNTINNCPDYKAFEQLQYRLEMRQQSIHEIQNPSQKDISNFLKGIV
jgi:hypothetical protein